MANLIFPTDFDEKTTIAQNDYVLFSDSEDSDKIKKAKYSNLKGEKGDTGTAATITVGSTTTGAAGTSASVTNSGTSSAAVLDFTIPKGDKGDTGATGADGADGQDGASIVSGAFSGDDLVFTKDDGNTVTITDAKIDLKGDTGNTGAAATIVVGTVSTGAAGSSATVTNSGTSAAAVFDFSIPQGDKGDTGATGNGIASITSSKSGKVTTVTITETDGDSSSFQISDGADGEGAGDVVGPNSSTDGNVVLFDGSTGKIIKDSGKTLTASGVGALADSTKYGASLSLSVNTTTYVVTAQLKDQDGNNLGSAATIDLPLESVVVSGSYDSDTKKVILTLENGSTVEFSIADLVSGLQSEITSNNMLDADLVDDSTSTNKFVTSSDKTTWNGKQDKIVAGTNITIAADGKTISATDTTYSTATSSTAGLVKLGSDTVQSVAANAVSGTASRTYALQLNSSNQLVVNVPREDHTYTASNFDIKDLTDSTNLRTTWSGKQDKHTATTVTLSSANWSSHTQTVSVTGVTASNTVIVSPAPSNFADYTNAMIYCSAQASGTLTFTCTTDPTSNITVNVVILS